MDIYNHAHSGEVLRENLPQGLSITDAANRLGVTYVTLSSMLNSKASISAEMDLLLAEALGTSAGLWSRIQVQYDIWQAKQKYRQHIALFPHAA
jgi:addiction module HigA family antidote